MKGKVSQVRKLLAMLIALAMLLQMTGPVFAEAEPAEVQEAVIAMAADAGLTEQEETPVAPEAPAEPEAQAASEETVETTEPVVVVEEAPAAPAAVEAPSEEAPVVVEETPAAPEAPAAEEELHLDVEPEAVETETAAEPVVVPFVATVSVKAESETVTEGENIVLTAKVETGVEYAVIWEAHDPAADVEGEEPVWTKVAEGDTYTFAADPAKAAVEYRAVAVPAEGEGRAVSAPVTVAVEAKAVEAVEVEAAPAEVETVPAEVEAAPAEVETVPAEVETAPAEVETVPAETEQTTPEAPKADDAEETKDETDGEESAVVIDVSIGGEEGEKAEETAETEAAEDSEEPVEGEEAAEGENAEDGEVVEEEVSEEEIVVEGAEDAYGSKTLPVNSTPVADQLNNVTKTSQIWKITTTTVGSLNVNVDPQTIMDSGMTMTVTLYNEDMGKVIDGPNTGSARVTAGFNWLDAGTYYVKVESSTYPAPTGILPYTIEAKQNAAGINMSNNRSQMNAYALSNDVAVTGAFTWQSAVDHYVASDPESGWVDYAQFTLSSASRVTIQMTNYIPKYLKVWLFNGNITEKLGTTPSFNVVPGAVNAGWASMREVYLEAGTYFLRIVPDAAEALGKYELRVKWVSCEATEVEPNGGIGNPTAISYGQTHRGVLTLTDDTDYYRIVTGAGYAQEVDITVNDGMGIKVSILDVNEQFVQYNSFVKDGYYYTSPAGTCANPDLTNPYSFPAGGSEADKKQGVFHVKLLPSTAYYIKVERQTPVSSTWTEGTTMQTGVYDITLTADKTVQSMAAAVFDNWAVVTGDMTDRYQAVARFTNPAPSSALDNGCWEVVNATTGAVLTPLQDYRIHGISTTSGQQGWLPFLNYTGPIPKEQLINHVALVSGDVWSAIVVDFMRPNGTYSVKAGDQIYFRFIMNDTAKNREHRHASFNVTIGGGTSVLRVNMPVIDSVPVGTQFTVTADLAAGSIPNRTYLWWIVDSATGKTVDTQVTTAPAATFTPTYTGTVFCQMFWWDPTKVNPITGLATGYWEYNTNHDSRNNSSPYMQYLTITTGMGVSSVVLTQKNATTLHVKMTTNVNPVYTNYVVYLDGVKQTDSYYFTNGTKEFDFTISNSGTYVVYGQAWDGVSGSWVTVPSNAVTVAAGDHLSAITVSSNAVSLGESVAFTMVYTGTLKSTLFQLYYFETNPGVPTLVDSFVGTQPVHIFALNKTGFYAVVGTATFASKIEQKQSELITVTNNKPYVVDASGNKITAGTTTSAIIISNKKPEKQKNEKAVFSISTGGSVPTSIKWELYRKSDNKMLISDVSNKKSFVLDTTTLDAYMNTSGGKQISTDFYVKVYLSSDPKSPYTYEWWQSEDVTVYLPTAPST